jgi:ATP synthase protein I
MNEQGHDIYEADPHDQMVEDICKKQTRKMRSRRAKDRATWFGLGMMGAVGWSIVVPTLLGIALGIWIDSRWPSPISWTLVLLIGGLLLGCVNVWFWVVNEQEAMEREKEEQDDE